MEQVMRIEKASFDFTWTEEDFLRCLRQRNCIGMVAVEPDSEEVYGFMIYELHKKYLHLLNLAVAPEHRHQGVGRQMVERLIEKLSHQRRKAITLEVRETNVAAQCFFAEMGFKAVRIIRGYYDDTDEDAYEMRYSLETEPVFMFKSRITDYVPDGNQ